VSTPVPRGTSITLIADLLATVLTGASAVVKRVQAGRELTAQQGCQLSRVLGRAADLASLHASIVAQRRMTLRPDEQVRVEGHERAVADYFAGVEDG
jgi:hypothetical protein